MGTILIIENDPRTLILLKAAFEGGSYAVKTATTFQEVLDVLPGLTTPLVVLVDEDFFRGSGVQVAKILREKVPGAKLVSISGNPEGITWGPDANFRRLFSINALMAKVKEFMEKS